VDEIVDGYRDAGPTAWTPPLRASCPIHMGAYEFNPYHSEAAMAVNTQGMQFTVRGEPGKTVRIDRSSDLLVWEPMATVPLPAGGQTLIDPAAVGEQRLFYRLAKP